jgi:hypothetical protein
MTKSYLCGRFAWPSMRAIHTAITYRELHIMRHIHKVGAAGVAAISTFLTITSTVPTSANAGFGLESATEFQHPENQLPLVSITSPSSLTTVTADAQVDVIFSSDAIASSFTARINGKDVTRYFTPSGRCARDSAWPLHRVIPQTDLLPGINTLMLDVNGPNQSAGTTRKQLVYRCPPQTRSSV